MSRAGAGRTAVAAAIGTLLVCAGAAQAATLQVRDNKPAALRKAIDRANPGDKLEVHRGRYTGSVEVDKRLRIVGVGKRRPIVDGGCADDITIDVLHAGVTLRHLKVTGASHEFGNGYEVNFIGITTGTARDLVVEARCKDTPEYGINLTSTGPIKVLDNRVFGGYIDGGIYVGGVGDTRGKILRVVGNESTGNNRGIIVEDSFTEEQRILVKDNVASNNRASGLASSPTGIYLDSSKFGRYIDNVVNNNGVYGFWLRGIHGSSDDNVFIGNTASSNDDQDFFIEDGTGNCGSGNSFTIDPC